jgi:hypothetical protein
MNPAERVFLDAGLFIGALLAGDARHIEARGIVKAGRRGKLAACTSVGVLAEDLWLPRSRDCESIRRNPRQRGRRPTWPFISRPAHPCCPTVPRNSAQPVRRHSTGPHGNKYFPNLSSVGSSPDAPASRDVTGRWSGRGCIPTLRVGTRKLPEADT